MVVRTKKRLWFVTVVIMCVLLVPFPSSQQMYTPFLRAEYSQSQAPDYWSTEGWQQSTPEDKGMNATLLEEMLDFCDDHNCPLRSTMIVRNGYMIHENYPNSEYNEISLIHVWSCTKSIVSILVGIAIEEGYISSIDEPIVNFFPDRTIANLDSRKESITLKHILSMSSGLQWDDTADFNQMLEETDWVQYVLDRPMAYTPGETWNYNSGSTHILSAILNNVTEMSPSDFAETHLFQPLGITDYERDLDSQGLEIGGWGIHLKPRDMAKIGFLYLNNGTWDTEQIISSNWVMNSTQVQSSRGFESGCSGQYGYLWWIKTSYNAYCVFGLNGQFIWILPEHNLVFITTSSDMRPYDYLVTEYILPSLGILDFTTSIIDTTTTTDTTIPDPSTIPIIVGAGISIAAITVVLVWFMKKRK